MKSEIVTFALSWDSKGEYPVWHEHIDLHYACKPAIGTTTAATIGVVGTKIFEQSTSKWHPSVQGRLPMGLQLQPVACIAPPTAANITHFCSRYCCQIRSPSLAALIAGGDLGHWEITGRSKQERV